MSVSDETSSQFVEVTEELRDSDALLAGNLSDASKNILDVHGSVSDNLSLAHSWFSLFKVVEAVVVSLSDSEKGFGTINLITEISVVNFVNVALIHVTSEDSLGDVLGYRNLKQIENTEELHFRHVTVFSAVEILENWLEVDAADIAAMGAGGLLPEAERP